MVKKLTYISYYPPGMEVIAVTATGVMSIKDNVRAAGRRSMEGLSGA